MEKIFQYLTAAGAGFVTYALGGWDTLLWVVIVVVFLDVASGIAASKKEGHTIRSAVMQAGLWKRVGYLVALILAVTLDLLLIESGAIGEAGLFRHAVLYAILLPEVKSIDENLGRLEVPLAGVFSNFADKIKDKAGPG